ncbi:hypothetical protein PR048_029373 [Dryococelus australis]|uniref:Uncharacterized protein n=1 Tax=Dryococelus australis TaxID=614101 RepID=A0ABQ9GD67_9NEOP|nr:hypothetical protein PR048_029373 [Dryococelus australis]
MPVSARKPRMVAWKPRGERSDSCSILRRRAGGAYGEVLPGGKDVPPRSLAISCTNNAKILVAAVPIKYEKDWFFFSGTSSLNKQLQPLQRCFSSDPTAFFSSECASQRRVLFQNCIYSLPIGGEDTVCQFRALRLVAMGHLMRLEVSPLMLLRFSVSNAGKENLHPGRLTRTQNERTVFGVDSDRISAESGDDGGECIREVASTPPAPPLSPPPERKNPAPGPSGKQRGSRVVLFPELVCVVYGAISGDNVTSLSPHPKNPSVPPQLSPVKSQWRDNGREGPYKQGLEMCVAWIPLGSWLRPLPLPTYQPTNTSSYISFIWARKCKIDKGDNAPHIKHALATTCKALNWRVVLIDEEEVNAEDKEEEAMGLDNKIGSGCPYYTWRKIADVCLSTLEAAMQSNVRRRTNRLRHGRSAHLYVKTVGLLASHKGGRPSSIPGRFTPKFSQVGIVPDDAADRQVSSGISHFPRPCVPALLHTHLSSPSSALKTSVLRAAQISSLTRLNMLQIAKAGGSRLRGSINEPASRKCLRFDVRWGRGGVVVGQLASHQRAPGSNPLGIVSDGAAGRRVFSGISRFPRPLHSDGAAPYSPHLTLIGSRDLDIKSRPNLSTHSLSPVSVEDDNYVQRVITVVHVLNFPLYHLSWFSKLADMHPVLDHKVGNTELSRGGSQLFVKHHGSTGTELLFAVSVQTVRQCQPHHTGGTALKHVEIYICKGFRRNELIPHVKRCDIHSRYDVAPAYRSQHIYHWLRSDRPKLLRVLLMPCSGDVVLRVRLLTWMIAAWSRIRTSRPATQGQAAPRVDVTVETVERRGGGQRAVCSPIYTKVFSSDVGRLLPGRTSTTPLSRSVARTRPWIGECALYIAIQTACHLWSQQCLDANEPQWPRELGASSC